MYNLVKLQSKKTRKICWYLQISTIEELNAFYNKELLNSKKIYEILENYQEVLNGTQTFNTILGQKIFLSLQEKGTVNFLNKLISFLEILYNQQAELLKNGYIILLDNTLINYFYDTPDYSSFIHLENFNSETFIEN